MTGSSSSGSLVQSVATSGIAQLFARAVDILVSLTVTYLVLHHLGRTGYGNYILVGTIAGVLGLVAELGLPKLAVREISRTPDSEAGVVGTVTVVRLALALVAMVLAQIVIFAFDPTATLRLAMLVASIGFAVEATLTVMVVFQARIAQQYEAAARLVGSIVKLVSVVVLVSLDAGLVALVGASVGSLVAISATAHLLARRRLASAWKFEQSRIRPLVIAALPVGPAALIGVLYLKLDAAMVGLLETRDQLGVYGAAYVPIEYLFLGSAVVIQVLFPIMARAGRRDAEGFRDSYNFGLDLLVGGFVGIGVFVAVFAQPMVDLAFGDGYEGAATPLAVLGIAVVFLVINAWQGSALLAVDQQRRNLGYLTVAVVANVVVDLILIPQIGIAGAAWGTLITSVGLVAASTNGVRRYCSVTVDLATLAPLAIAALIAGALAAASRAIGFPDVAALLIGLLAWLVATTVSARPAVDRARRVLSGSSPSIEVVPQ